MAYTQICMPDFETTHCGSKAAFSNSSWDSYSSEYKHQEYSNRGYSMNQHQGHHVGQMHKYPSGNHVSGHSLTDNFSEHISHAASINNSRMPAYYGSAYGASGGQAFEWGENVSEHISNATGINRCQMPAYSGSAHGAAGGHAFERTDKITQCISHIGSGGSNHGHHQKLAAAVGGHAFGWSKEEEEHASFSQNHNSAAVGVGRIFGLSEKKEEHASFYSAGKKSKHLKKGMFIKKKKSKEGWCRYNSDSSTNSSSSSSSDSE
ncbi:hypothetical protein Ancab_015431 [Ancistrocladus abbreviatus]